MGEERHPQRPKPEPFRMRLTNVGNAQYFGDFRIGGQTLRGIFDTGSFDLLVLSMKCERCRKAGREGDYNYKLSKTYERNGTVRRHVFGSGPAVSEMGYDTVEVGPQLVAKGQTFYEILDHQIEVLDEARFNAIVGMGIGPGPADSSLLTSVNVSEFAVCFERGDGLPKDTPGWLTWGPVTRNAVRQGGDFVRVPVLGVHHWAVALSKVAVDTMAPMGGGICSSGCAAIVDTGTSLIAAPYPHLMALSRFIGHVKEDCSNLDQLPTLILNLGEGQEFRLPPRAYVLRITGAYMEANSVWEVLMFKPKVRNLNICVPAFMQIHLMSQLGPVWILGMPFFRYYHTTFDRKRRELQVATAEKDCSWSPLPPKKVAMEPGSSAGSVSPLNRPIMNGQAPGAAGAVEAGEIRVRGTRTLKPEDTVPTEVDIGALVPPTLSFQLGTPEKPVQIEL